MPKRILVVDDDANIAQLIKLNLAMHGYEVSVAYDGRAGLAAAQRDLPDLIILDIMMPVMSGREMLQHLKREERTANIPVLMLTVLTEASDIMRSLVHGAEWHLSKPFEVSELVAMVKRLTTSDPAAAGTSE